VEERTLGRALASHPGPAVAYVQFPSATRLADVAGVRNPGLCADKAPL
jgi:hypothetical protein